MFHEILRISANEKYDIVIFDKIPWYLKGEIIENGKVIYAANSIILISGYINKQKYGEKAKNDI